MNENNKKQISIVIPSDMYEWLEEHKEINRSKIFREAVQRIQSPSKNVSSLMFLATIMGIIFAIVLIGISTTPYIHGYLRAVIALLGGFLAVATSLVYYKERRKISS